MNITKEIFIYILLLTYFLAYTQEQNQCDKQQYYDQGRRSCQPCYTGCLECSDKKTCQICDLDQHFQLNENKCECQPGYLFDYDESHQLLCKQCVYYDNICVNKCPPNSTFNEQTRECKIKSYLRHKQSITYDQFILIMSILITFFVFGLVIIFHNNIKNFIFGKSEEEILEEQEEKLYDEHLKHLKEFNKKQRKFERKEKKKQEKLQQQIDDNLIIVDDYKTIRQKLNLQNDQENTLEIDNNQDKYYINNEKQQQNNQINTNTKKNRKKLTISFPKIKQEINKNNNIIPKKKKADFIDSSVILTEISSRSNNLQQKSDSRKSSGPNVFLKVSGLFNSLISPYKKSSSKGPQSKYGSCKYINTENNNNNFNNLVNTGKSLLSSLQLSAKNKNSKNINFQKSQQIYQKLTHSDLCTQNQKNIKNTYLFSNPNDHSIIDEETIQDAKKNYKKDLQINDNLNVSIEFSDNEQENNQNNDDNNSKNNQNQKQPVFQKINWFNILDTINLTNNYNDETNDQDNTHRNKLISSNYINGYTANSLQSLNQNTTSLFTTNNLNSNQLLNKIQLKSSQIMLGSLDQFDNNKLQDEKYNKKYDNYNNNDSNNNISKLQLSFDISERVLINKKIDEV